MAVRPLDTEIAPLVMDERGHNLTVAVEDEEQLVVELHAGLLRYRQAVSHRLALRLYEWLGRALRVSA